MTNEDNTIIFDISFIWQHSEEPVYLMEDSE